MGTDGPGGGRFRAMLLAITEVENVPLDLMPFVQFRSAIEGRNPAPQDLVAVFNVLTTSSHFVVFLDPGKSIAQVEAEMAPYDVVLPAETWRRLESVLETRSAVHGTRV